MYVQICREMIDVKDENCIFGGAVASALNGR